MKEMSINFFPGKGVLIVLFLISGCASYTNNVKIDDATAAKLRSEVAIYDSKKMDGLEYEAIQNIQATACSSRENAMDQLRYIAHSAGANGITKVSCGSILGPSFRQDCLTTVMCEAVAIRVRTHGTEGERIVTEKVEEPEQSRIISGGEGFTLGRLPLVVTSYYTVGKSGDVEIIFSGNYAANGRVVKKDEENNLAIIAFKEFRKAPSGFRIFPSYKVKSGQDSYVISYIPGSQSAGRPRIAKGVVSATEGPGGDSKYFTITATGNTPNAGSPLLDTQGRVIGIVSTAPRKATSIKGAPLPETHLALKSTILLNLYPEIENLVDSENEPALSPDQILETYGSSVVSVIAK